MRVLVLEADVAELDGPLERRGDGTGPRVLSDVVGDAEGSRFYWALVDNAIAEDADERQRLGNVKELGRLLLEEIDPDLTTACVRALAHQSGVAIELGSLARAVELGAAKAMSRHWQEKMKKPRAR